MGDHQAFPSMPSSFAQQFETAIASHRLSNVSSTVVEPLRYATSAAPSSTSQHQQPMHINNDNNPSLPSSSGVLEMASNGSPQRHPTPNFHSVPTATGNSSARSNDNALSSNQMKLRSLSPNPSTSQPFIQTSSVQRTNSTPVISNYRSSNPIISMISTAQPGRQLVASPTAQQPYVMAQQHQNPWASPKGMTPFMEPFAASQLMLSTSPNIGPQQQMKFTSTDSQIPSTDPRLDGPMAGDQAVMRQKSSALSQRWRSLSLFVQEIWGLPGSSNNLRPFCKIRFNSFSLQTIPSNEPTQQQHDGPHQLGWVVKFPIPTTKGRNPTGVIGIDIYDPSTGRGTPLGHAEFDIASMQPLNDWRFDGILNVVPSGFLKVEAELSGQPVGTPSLQRPPWAVGSSSTPNSTIGNHLPASPGRPSFGPLSSQSLGSPSAESLAAFQANRASIGGMSATMGSTTGPPITARMQSVVSRGSEDGTAVNRTPRRISHSSEGPPLKPGYPMTSSSNPDHQRQPQYMSTPLQSPLLSPTKPSSFLHSTVAGISSSYIPDTQRRISIAPPVLHSHPHLGSSPLSYNTSGGLSIAQSGSISSTGQRTHGFTSPPMQRATMTTHRSQSQQPPPSPSRLQSHPVRSPSLHWSSSPLFSSTAPNTAGGPAPQSSLPSNSTMASSDLNILSRVSLHSSSSLNQHIGPPTFTRALSRGLHSGQETSRAFPVLPGVIELSAASLPARKTSIERRTHHSTCSLALLSPIEQIDKKPADEIPEAYWRCPSIESSLWDEHNESRSPTIKHEPRCLSHLLSQLPSTCPIIKTIRLFLHSVVIHSPETTSPSSLFTLRGRLALDHELRLSFESITGTITFNGVQTTRDFSLSNVIFVPYGFEQHLQLHFKLESPDKPGGNLYVASLDLWKVLGQMQRRVTGKLPIFEHKNDERSKSPNPDGETNNDEGIGLEPSSSCGFALLGIELMSESTPVSMMSQSEFERKAAGTPQVPERFDQIQSLRQRTTQSTAGLTPQKDQSQDAKAYKGLRVILSAHNTFPDSSEGLVVKESIVIKVSLGSTIALKGRLDIGGRPLEFVFPYVDEQTLKLAALPDTGVTPGSPKTSTKSLGTLRLNLVEAVKSFHAFDINTNEDRDVHGVLRIGQQLQVASLMTSTPMCSVTIDLSFAVPTPERPLVRTMASILMDDQNRTSLTRSVPPLDCTKITRSTDLHSHAHHDKVLDQQASWCSSSRDQPLTTYSSTHPQLEKLGSLSSSHMQQTHQQQHEQLKSPSLVKSSCPKSYSHFLVYLESAQVFIPVDDSVQVPLTNVLLTCQSGQPIDESTLDGIALVTEMDLYASIRFGGITVKTKAIKKTHSPRLHTLCSFPHKLEVLDPGQPQKALEGLLSDLSIQVIDRRKTPVDGEHQQVPVLMALTSLELSNGVFSPESASQERKCRCVISGVEDFLQGEKVVLIMPLFCAQNQSRQVGEVRILVQLTDEKNMYENNDSPPQQLDTPSRPAATRLDQAARLPFTTILKDFIKQQARLFKLSALHNMTPSTTASITPSSAKVRHLINHHGDGADLPSELDFSQCKSIGIIVDWGRGHLPEEVKQPYFKLRHGRSLLRSPVVDMTASTSKNEPAVRQKEKHHHENILEDESNPQLMAKVPFDQKSMIILELLDRQLPHGERTIGMAAIDPTGFNTLYNANSNIRRRDSSQDGQSRTPKAKEVDEEEERLQREGQLLSYRSQRVASAVGNKFGVPTWSAELLLPFVSPQVFNSTTSAMSPRSLDDAKCCLRVRIDLLKLASDEPVMSLSPEVKTLLVESLSDGDHPNSN